MITGNLTLTDWLLIEHNNGSAAKEIISGVGRVATPVLGKGLLWEMRPSAQGKQESKLGATSAVSTPNLHLHAAVFIICL